MIGIDADRRSRCSAKTGEGIDDILEAVVEPCPPRGNPDGLLRAMIIDWLVRQLRRRRDAGARGRRSLSKGERIRLMASDAVYGIDILGVHAQVGAARRALKAGEVGSSSPASRSCGGQGRRHHHAGEKAAQQRRPGHRPLPGFKEIQPQVFAGHVPDRGRASTTSCATRWKSSSSTMLAALRARGQPGAGFRLPLWLPRPAAHGDRAGAPGARVRPGPDHHRAQRRLRGRAERRRTVRGREPVEDARQGRIPRSASRSSRCTCTCRRTTSAR